MLIEALATILACSKVFIKHAWIFGHSLYRTCGFEVSLMQVLREASRAAKEAGAEDGAGGDSGAGGEADAGAAISF
ncbi:GL18812 [Drosophila persimilis]|uniref:GL18812 n=1 Tax=Drosophila persimilis TaxID=7234 RepID=B4G8L3_DROPE|nr:GL18812 [Drosophila persimilis]